MFYPMMTGGSIESELGTWYVHEYLFRVFIYWKYFLLILFLLYKIHFLEINIAFDKK